MTTSDKPGSGELWAKVVKEIVGKPTEELTLLDLCCCECTVTSKLKWKEHVGVDVVDWPTRRPITSFHKADALAYCEVCKPFDVVVCSDGIEHLTKGEGLTLLTEAKRVGKLVIIFTPLGDYMVEPDSTHPDQHRSGWLPQEFSKRGWKVASYPNWHPTLGFGAFFAWKGAV